jgi:hypothetical protein
MYEYNIKLHFKERCYVSVDFIHVAIKKYITVYGNWIFNIIYLFRKATRGLEHISYKGALLSTLLHATVYIYIYMFLHNLLNVLVQIANKMGLQKKIIYWRLPLDTNLSQLNQVHYLIFYIATYTPVATQQKWSNNETTAVQM